MFTLPAISSMLSSSFRPIRLTHQIQAPIRGRSRKCWGKEDENHWENTVCPIETWPVCLSLGGGHPRGYPASILTPHLDRTGARQFSSSHTALAPLLSLSPSSLSASSLHHHLFSAPQHQYRTLVATPSYLTVYHSATATATDCEVIQPGLTLTSHVHAVRLT